MLIFLQELFAPLLSLECCAGICVSVSGLPAASAFLCVSWGLMTTKVRKRGRRQVGERGISVAVVVVFLLFLLLLLLFSCCRCFCFVLFLLLFLLLLLLLLVVVRLVVIFVVVVGV